MKGVKIGGRAGKGEGGDKGRGAGKEGKKVERGGRRALGKARGAEMREMGGGGERRKARKVKTHSGSLLESCN